MHDDGTTAVVVAHGEIDLASAPYLLRTMVAACGLGVREVVVDLAAVTFVDSAGLKALVQGRAEARERGVLFRLDPVAPSVRSVLDLTGLSQLFAFDGSSA
jgi:anti-anti-sigma factor